MLSFSEEIVLDLTVHNFYWSLTRSFGLPNFDWSKFSKQWILIWVFNSCPSKSYHRQLISHSEIWKHNFVKDHASLLTATSCWQVELYNCCSFPGHQPWWENFQSSSGKDTWIFAQLTDNHSLVPCLGITRKPSFLQINSRNFVIGMSSLRHQNLVQFLLIDL